MSFVVKRLACITDAQIVALADLLIDCVEGGASVSFMSPLSFDKASAFWRRVAQATARDERALLVAEDSGGIIGTVQLILDLPENQPHRADLSKMLVHRRARRQGMGAAMLRAAEELARELGKSLLVLDTASGEAERLYGYKSVPFQTMRCLREAAYATRRSTIAAWYLRLTIVDSEASVAQKRGDLTRDEGGIHHARVCRAHAEMLLRPR
jgi:GNAT superfamily N-acetyltransferase